MLSSRVKSYNNIENFFNKLLYTFDDGKKVIDVIADKLTEFMGIEDEPITSVLSEDGSIYLNYPNFNIRGLNNGSYVNIYRVHLTFHTGGKPIKQYSFIPNYGNNNNYNMINSSNFPHQENKIMTNKIHFKFSISNYNYILPLIQNGNKLSRKNLYKNKKIIGDSLIYNGDLENINNIIQATVEIIENVLNDFDIFIEEQRRIAWQKSEEIRISKKKVIKWGGKKYGSKEKNKLNSIKTKYLLEYCKKNKLKGYSEYNKKDLINFIKNNVTKKLT